jgi:hypothetical protein
MRMVLILASAAMLVAPAAASAASPEQLESSVWQAFKAKNANAFKALVTANYVGVYDTGPSTIASELNEMKLFNISNFAISHFSARRIDAGEDVLTVYDIDLKGTRGKTDISGRYHAASVWHHAGNKWLTAFHTEMKAK